MSRMSVLLVLGVALAAMAVVPAAKADTATFYFYTDYCTNPCLGGVPGNNNGGTVTLTNDGLSAGQVRITVQLAAGLAFHDQGLPSFVFNGPAGLSLVSFSSDGGSWSGLEVGPIHADGAGTFQYGFDCTGGSGTCVGSPTMISFVVSGAGLTLAQLESLNGGSSNVDFAANVANGGCTGMIGAGNGLYPNQSANTTSGTGSASSCTPVPEPASLALLGSGLLALGGFARKWFR